MIYDKDELPRRLSAREHLDEAEAAVRELRDSADPLEPLSRALAHISAAKFMLNDRATRRR